MSGSGIWRLRTQVKRALGLSIAGFALLIAAVSVACGSQNQPSPTPEPASAGPTAAAPQSASADSSVTPSPVTPGAQPAAALKPGLSPQTALGGLPSLAEVIEKVNPAVVSISVESVSSGLFFDFTDEGAGSGVVISPNGYVVTNFHVIQDALGIKVSLPNGKTYDGRVVGWDVLTDLAVLKIEAAGLPTVKFGDSNALRPGDWVVALGNALALKGGPTVTAGIVSARGRTVNTERGALYDMIQTDAAINEGNSGGPLINLAGEVVGINTVILRQAQGIGFAVSSSVASPIIDSLIKDGRVVRPLIGLTGVDVTPARASQLNLNVTEGIIVTTLSKNGPAYNAGIRVGDVITKINGAPTTDMAQFLTLLWTYKAEDVVRVEYISSGRTSVTSVHLAERLTN